MSLNHWVINNELGLLEWLTTWYCWCFSSRVAGNHRQHVIVSGTVPQLAGPIANYQGPGAGGGVALVFGFKGGVKAVGVLIKFPRRGVHLLVNAVELIFFAQVRHLLRADRPGLGSLVVGQPPGPGPGQAGGLHPAL